MHLASGSLNGVYIAAILPGSFHPPTVAHLALAEAALARVDRVVFTLPEKFPHKEYGAVGQSERLGLLARLVAGNPGFAVAVSRGGLFVEMADELRELRPELRQVFVLCGRDAAERIVEWPYRADQSIDEQLTRYRLLVAARAGEYRPPARLSASIEPLPLARSWDDVSATAVREAIASGGDWRALVPPEIHEPVEGLYRQLSSTDR